MRPHGVSSSRFFRTCAGVALCCLGLALGAFSVQATSPVASDWEIVASPNSRPTPTSNFTYAVTCVTASDCWAVGYYIEGGSFQTLIEHWDGNEWTVVSSPNTSPTQNNILRGVTCSSATDCWAVGSYHDGSFQQTLILRWNGGAWNIVASPNTGASHYNYLFSVTCTSASDCWAVGYYVNGSNPFQTLIQRWDGNAWTLVTSPNTSAAQQNFFNGVTCAAANDCWAVGYYVHGTTGFNQTLIARWNGIAWSIVTSPNALLSTNNSLTSVTCVSASDCWAVGHSFNGNVEQTLIERWNGSAWSVVTSPSSALTQNNQLLHVTCTNATNCWAVGNFESANGPQTLIERWNGTAWSIVGSPNTGPTQDNKLWGVACAGPECWAAGSAHDGTVSQTLMQRWNGSVWTITPSPNTNSAQHNTLLGATCVSESDCWAVASFFNGSVQQTLIEHWDGNAWSIVPSPNTSPTQSNILYDVTCTAADDCWTVGYHLDVAGWQTLIMRWDGTVWSIVPSPSTGATESNFLTNVTCTSASDCWAVGFYDTGIAYQTLIEHWNGSAWSLVASPNTETTKENRLFGVTCATPNDCWAVGRYFTGEILQTLILGWNGSAWNIVPSANSSPNEENNLQDVTCASPTDCWAVGNYGVGSGTAQPLIERWNGTAWSIVPSPAPTSNPFNYNFLRGVTCTSSSDCWSVGYSFMNGVYQPLIERWDGNAWSIASTPSTSPTQSNYLTSLTCSSAANCWAVGYYATAGGIFQTLTMRYTTPTPVPLLSVASRKTHGSAGVFEIDLPLTGDPAIECPGAAERRTNTPSSSPSPIP